jgi:ribosome-associated protein
VGVDELRLGGRLTIPSSELSWRFSHSGGPGGQGVNTSDSRVELSWDVGSTTVLSPLLKERALNRLEPRLTGTTLTVVASEFRSQLLNRRAAAARLVAIVSAAIAPPRQARRPTRPTATSVERRLTAKKRRGDLKRRRRGEFD